MSLPLFLRGMLIALTAFAITTYVVTQSVWTTFVWTLICGLLIQTGYFATVLILIWGSSHRQKDDSETPEDKQIQTARENGGRRGGAGSVPGRTRPSQL